MLTVSFFIKTNKIQFHLKIMDVITFHFTCIIDGIQSSPKPSESDAYPEKTLARNPLLTDAAQSVLDMGYLPKQVKQAVDMVLKTKSKCGRWIRATN